MKIILKSLVLGMASMFASQSFATAVDIDCPEVKECFDCWVNRVAPNKVKFEFTRSSSVPGRNWSPIVMIASTRGPIANTEKATPDLEVLYPIQLARAKNGDWTIACQYTESGKYGGHVGYTPMTTLTIQANQVKSCALKNDRIVTCITN